MDLRTRQLIGTEAVVRWDHPEHGPISPDVFVAIAEQSDLIQQLTRYVMHQAFEDCARWRAQGLPLTVAVNLSGCCLAMLDLPDRISQLAASVGLDSQAVVIELTESCITDDLVTAADVLTRVRIKGFELSHRRLRDRSLDAEAAEAYAV